MCAFLNTVIISVWTNCRLTALAMCTGMDKFTEQFVSTERLALIVQLQSKLLRAGQFPILTDSVTAPHFCFSLFHFHCVISLCHFYCLCVSFSLSPCCACVSGVTFPFFPLFCATLSLCFTVIFPHRVLYVVHGVQGESRGV